MNHTTDTHFQDSDSDDDDILDRELDSSGKSKDLRLLEILIDKAIKTLEDDSSKPRIRDALKAVQLKEKVAKKSDAEKFFWDQIEEIRQEELPKLYPDSTDTEGLEAQLLTAIAGLKHHLKNGILPLKLIADLKTQNSGTFNQERSKQTRLSYQRIARLLSKIGFRKVKTHGGRSAILWNDKLLPQNTFSNADLKTQTSGDSRPLDG